MRSQSTPRKKKKILIVDDDMITLKMLEKILSSGGYSVIQTTDGNAAILIAKKEHPNIVILDITMPSIDGISVATMLKSDPKTRNTPIILLSSLIEKEISRAQNAIPGISFLPKPIKQADLIRQISEHLLDNKFQT